MPSAGDGGKAKVGGVDACQDIVRATLFPGGLPARYASGGSVVVDGARWLSLG